MAFLDKWKDFGPSFERVLNNHYKTCLFHSGFESDIEQILVPLKLFPASKVGRGALLNNQAFQDALKKMVIFRLVISNSF